MSRQDEYTMTIAMTACTEVVKMLGLSAGELTQRKAEQAFGTWFKDEVKAGNIKPCRFGTKTRWYSVTDILAHKAAQLKQATLLQSNN